ncbi:MAG: sensor histidine kinase, partial [Sciscionella sp.]
MVPVATLLTVPPAFAVIAILVVIALVVVLIRTRRQLSSSVDDAVMGALSRIANAGSDLRGGLDQAAADKAAPHLRGLLQCVAVGLTDQDGTLLSWDGEATEHYDDLTGSIAAAIANHRREHVEHENLHCENRGTCPMRTAVIVPLIGGGDNAGALVVVGGVGGQQLVRMADEIAKFVRTQLELAALDESKQQLAQAEVRTLRAQISPHFIYNALNTISSLIRTDPERARDLLLEFADFTRYSFRTSGMFTTLSEELLNIDRYLMLERARYGSRVNFRLRIAPEVQSLVVPFLVLQPLVENAVRHGLAKKPDGGTVTVIAQDQGSDVLISVEDDGIGMDADRLTADLANAHLTGAHVGIGNINQRMRSVFGNEYALMAETAPGEGMKVTLRVPKSIPGVRPVQPSYTEKADDDSEDDLYD